MKRKVATGRTGKPLVGVVAFLGRGNSGDEAMFQCIYEAFSPDFDIVAVVDEMGACAGFWDWYPYTQCDRIHIGNIHYFEKPMAGLIVGGGGLGIGFGAAQALVAKSRQTPVVLAGIDHMRDYPPPSVFLSAMVEYTNLFDYVSMRSLESVQKAREDGIGVNYGADWAIKLTADTSDLVTVHPRRVVVVLREYSSHHLFSRDFYKQEVERLIISLQKEGLSPEFLPFSPEDEKFLVELAVDHLAPTHIHWWNARLVKQIIKSSGLLISVGRLHPMIYAFGAGTPCVQLQPPIKPQLNPRHFGKTLVMAEEYGIPYFYSVEETLNSVRTSRWESFHSEEKATDSRLRLEKMIDDIRSLFLSSLESGNVRQQHEGGESVAGQIVKDDLNSDYLPNSELVVLARKAVSEQDFELAEYFYQTLFSRTGYLPGHIIDYVSICIKARMFERAALAMRAFMDKGIDEKHKECFSKFLTRKELLGFMPDEVVSRLLGARGNHMLSEQSIKASRQDF